MCIYIYIYIYICYRHIHKYVCHFFERAPAEGVPNSSCDAPVLGGIHMYMYT